jgi:enolase-phosphatase E1
MDIEGTTTDIHFVKNVLFPYSAQNLKKFLEKNLILPEKIHTLNHPAAPDESTDIANETRACFIGVQNEIHALSQPNDFEHVVSQLQKWIADDIKHPLLKKLQGMIWADGYKNTSYFAHVYSDVIPAWQNWQSRGITLGIYSSGSIEAQKLLFGHTEQGDVRKYLSHYFDLGVGSKRDVSSYQKIASIISDGSSISAPAHILFLSDIVEELSAANKAGFQTALIDRTLPLIKGLDKPSDGGIPLEKQEIKTQTNIKNDCYLGPFSSFDQI